MTVAADVREHAHSHAWPGLHIVAIVAVLLRLAVAWWSVRITYPDELFQYLEQAHRLVYGYGIVPWEFRLAARNWLLPGTLGVLLEVLRAIGLDRPTIYIPLLKSLFALISVSLVYASYSIGRNLFCERTARLAAVVAAIWYELLYVTSVATPEVLSAYAIVGALALVTGHASARRAVLVGLLLGASIALRVQYVVPATALWFLVVIKWQRRCALNAALAGAIVIGFAGLLDAWSWGTAFISYYNNLNFNLLLDKEDAFGRSPLLAYFYWLVTASAGLFLVAAGYGAIRWKRCWPILLLLACVLVPHSLIPHKEYRFVILAVPLLLRNATSGCDHQCLAAAATRFWSHDASQRRSRHRGHGVCSGVCHTRCIRPRRSARRNARPFAPLRCCRRSRPHRLLVTFRRLLLPSPQRAALFSRTDRNRT